MLEFYMEVFSLKVAVHQQERGHYIDTVFGEKGVNIEVYKLAFCDGSLLELIDFKNRCQSALEKRQLYEPGQIHLAVTVDSAEEVHAKFMKRGCQVLSKPCVSADGKVKVFFARDIEGNYLELVEEL